MDLIATILRNYAANNDEKILISNSFGQIQALLSERILLMHRHSAKQCGESMLEEYKQKFPNSRLLIGISDCCEKINQFHEGYKQAKKSLEIAQIKGHEQRVFQFSELGYISLLLDARNPLELRDFADKILGPLYDHDIQKSTELLNTLYLYLDNECNLHKTARYMNLSIGGMRYRLAMVKDKFNIDMTNAGTRREVQMALDIYLAFGKLPLSNSVNDEN
jgi:sugar diacid utilization regulator